MGKSIKVDMSKLDVASSKLTELSGTYEQISKQLISDATTMGEAWQGEDNQAFCNQIKGFMEELNQMAQKLKLAGEALNKQSTNYKTRQDAVTSAAKQLPN